MNFFSAEKKKIGPSGGAPSKWKLYDKVHEVLGSFKSINTEGLVEESSNACSNFLQETSGEKFFLFIYAQSYN